MYATQMRLLSVSVHVMLSILMTLFSMNKFTVLPLALLCQNRGANLVNVCMNCSVTDYFFGGGGGGRGVSVIWQIEQCSTCFPRNNNNLIDMRISLNLVK